MFDYGILDVIVGKNIVGTMEHGVMSVLQNVRGVLVVYCSCESFKVKVYICNLIKKRNSFGTSYGLRFSSLFAENFYPTRMKCAPPFAIKEVA